MRLRDIRIEKEREREREREHIIMCYLKHYLSNLMTMITKNYFKHTCLLDYIKLVKS